MSEKLKEFLKKIPGVHTVGSGCKQFIFDVMSIPNFLAERRISRPDGPIRVGFLFHYIPAWHNTQGVYTLMKEDPRFEPYLICIPSDISDPEAENDVHKWFLQEGYTEAINARQADGSWLDLQRLGLEYVFYSRPYDVLIPPEYASSRVCRYSKICAILYAISMTKEIVSVTLNRDFFRNVSFYFAELPYNGKVNRKKGWLLHKLGLQESIYYGIPGIEEIFANKDRQSPAWDFSKNHFRAMWTPRWTTELSLGGSNFFTFYKALLDYAQENPDVDFLFRPHPLTLEHFQQTGEMTKEEADAFVARCNEIPNVSLDKEKEYLATFWNTDVLISDVSGILPEYFATGMPLIFCAGNMILTPGETLARILEGSYIVYTEEELFRCIQMLKSGEDPLAGKRAEIVRELYGDDFRHPAQKIVSYLAQKN